MAQPLTTEYLDKVLDKKLKENFELTTEYVDKKFEAHAKVIDKKFDDFEKIIDTKFELLFERTNILETQIKDLEQKMNFRFSLVEAELEEIKADLKAYSKRDKDDSDAFNRDMIKLQKRVSNLEEQVKKLKVQQKQAAKA